MKIYSEKTNKEYQTVEECLEAEKAFDEAAAVEQAKKKALANERKADADKVETKRQAAIEAQKEYRKELAAFCEKHGAYHYSIKPGEGYQALFSHIFDNFWL